MQSEHMRPNPREQPKRSMFAGRKYLVPNRLQRGFHTTLYALGLGRSLRSYLLVPRLISKFPLCGEYAMGLASAARKPLEGRD